MKGTKSLMTYNEKMLFILAQGKPTMKHLRKFEYHINSSIGPSGIREWQVSIILGKDKNVIFEETFNTESEAKNWGDRFLLNHKELTA